MSQISSSIQTSDALRTPNQEGFGQLSSDEFLQIILTEMSRQDPLQPNDTSALLEQLGTIRSIEADVELGDKLDALVSQNQFATAGGLIGTIVAGRTAQFEPATGVVVSVSKTDEGPILNLDTGQRVPFESLDEFILPSALDFGDDDTEDDEPDEQDDEATDSTDDEEPQA